MHAFSVLRSKRKGHAKGNLGLEVVKELLIPKRLWRRADFVFDLFLYLWKFVSSKFILPILLVQLHADVDHMELKNLIYHIAVPAVFYTAFRRDAHVTTQCNLATAAHLQSFCVSRRSLLRDNFPPGPAGSICCHIFAIRGSACTLSTCRSCSACFWPGSPLGC